MFYHLFAYNDNHIFKKSCIVFICLIINVFISYFNISYILFCNDLNYK